MIDGGASWNYATFGWCIGGSLVHAPIFETRFVLHMGVPMKNAAILDCIRSGQPSGCRKLSLWTYEANWYSPPSAAISSSRRLIVCKAAAILQQEKAAVKIQVPFKIMDFPSDEPVLFTRGPAERKVWTKSRMPQRREDFDAYRPCLHLVSNSFTMLHLYNVSEMSWYITIGGRRESKSKQGKRNCDIWSNVSWINNIRNSWCFMPFQSIS